MQGNGIDANRRLAELLGWTAIFNVGGALLGTPPPGSPACRNQAKVPDWTGDWRDCGPLMVAHARFIGIHGPWVSVSVIDGWDLSWCRDDGESEDEATRRGIVTAVIMKLQEGGA
jgi:hypothetical protein